MTDFRPGVLVVKMKVPYYPALDTTFPYKIISTTLRHPQTVVFELFILIFIRHVAKYIPEPSPPK